MIVVFFYYILLKVLPCKTLTELTELTELGEKS